MKISSVDEYKAFAKKHNLPLDKMRFALERKHDPKWFYLYYEPLTEEWIVAKNKADGSTAIRYRGPSEATACQILFDKMEEEAKNRGYLQNSNPKSKVKLRWYENPTTYIWLTVLFIFVVSAVVVMNSTDSGYYVNRATGRVHYHQGSSDYLYDDYSDSWYYADIEGFDGKNYEDSYDYYDTYDFENTYGPQYFGDDSDWNFSGTTYYEDYHSSSSTSSSDWDSDDYSSWDSGDTDWGSDW